MEYTLFENISLLHEDPVEEVLLLLGHIRDINKEWMFIALRGVLIEG